MARRRLLTWRPDHRTRSRPDFVPRLDPSADLRGPVSRLPGGQLGNRRQGRADPANPQLIAGGGKLHRAYSIEALAQSAGLPAENLTATVADYNDAVRFNRLLTLLPERSTLSGTPRRIETRPFFATPICAGIANTWAASPSTGMAG